jgi:hypothetical protein
MAGHHNIVKELGYPCPAKRHRGIPVHAAGGGGAAMGNPPKIAEKLRKICGNCGKITKNLRLNRGRNL